MYVMITALTIVVVCVVGANQLFSLNNNNRSNRFYSTGGVYDNDEVVSILNVMESLNAASGCVR